MGSAANSNPAYFSLYAFRINLRCPTFCATRRYRTSILELWHSQSDRNHPKSCSPKRANSFQLKELCVIDGRACFRRQVPAELPLRHRLRFSFLVAFIVGKYFFNVLSPVENTHNFGPIILQTIKDDLRTSGERTQTRPDFVARPPSKRKVINSRNNLRNFTQDFVCGRQPCAPRREIPDPR